jgi:hypothetical protein
MPVENRGRDHKHFMEIMGKGISTVSGMRQGKQGSQTHILESSSQLSQSIVATKKESVNMKSTKLTLEDGRKKFDSLSPEDQQRILNAIGLENISSSLVVMSRMRDEMEGGRTVQQWLDELSKTADFNK